MTFIERIYHSAASSRKRVVLPEGEDPRILDAAAFSLSSGIADAVLLGNESRIASQLEERVGSRSGIEIVDPAQCGELDRYAGEYLRLRSHRGATEESSLAAMSEPLGFAAMMVRLGDADGTVAGAVASSEFTIRTALQVIGRAAGTRTVSSFFVMVSETPGGPLPGECLFADCALIVEPGAEELAEIAGAAARNTEALLGVRPRVAFLSFSTAGSAAHPKADVVREAARIATVANPGIEFEGEIQFDAAIDPVLRAVKSPDSALTGTPNVFVFPNLDAGNIGYKIAQRIGGMSAIGPVLQGLAKPANDLSRGCSTEDVKAMLALTAVQAQG